MSIKEIPQTYQTSDGETFTIAKEAKKHQELLDATQAFNDAKKHLGRLYAQSFKTADGEFISLRLWTKYWYVLTPFRQRPRLEEVEFRWYVEIDSRTHVPVIHTYSSGEAPRSYELTNLYAEQQNAENALLAALKEWHAEEGKEIAELEQRLSATDRS